MVRAVVCATLAALICALLAPAAAYPSAVYREDPEEILDLMTRLGRLLQLERRMNTLSEEAEYMNYPQKSEKRGIDMGLGRGISGAIQAKHLMGIAAANFAGGPGRRRRAVQP